MHNLLFIGNDGGLLAWHTRWKNTRLAGVVADKVSKEQEKVFGSSYLIARKLKLPLVSQKRFNSNCRQLLENCFSGTGIILIHGYHYKIKPEVYNHKELRVINFHQSLLPYYAGRHPLNWAIINGEETTGITFHFANERFDGGDIIYQKKIPIRDKDDVLSLYHKTIFVGRSSLDKVFASVYNKEFAPIKQDLSKRTYFPARLPADGEVLESDTVRQIRNKIRALVFPYPGSFCYLDGKKIIIDGIKRIRNSKKYNELKFIRRFDSHIILKAQDGILKVTKLREERA